MKKENKSNNHGTGLRTDLVVRFHELRFLEAMVEELADRGTDMKCEQQTMPCGMLAVAASSLEAYVSGSVFLPGTGDPPIDMSFTTCFLFTCLTTHNDTYKLTWSNSLS